MIDGPNIVLLASRRLALVDSVEKALQGMVPPLVALTAPELDAIRASLASGTILAILVDLDLGNERVEAIASVATCPVIGLVDGACNSVVTSVLRHGVWNLVPIDASGVWQQCLGPLILQAVDQRQTLEKSRDELKDFVYIISHDLKAPMRGILSVTEWVATDYKNQLDSDGQEMLVLLNERAMRLTSMVDAVLEFSRIGRGNEESRPTDTAARLQSAIAKLPQLPSPRTCEVIVHTPMSIVQVDPERCEQVFSAILVNAVTFCDKPACRITVECSVDDQRFATFRIADNGPGIPEKDSQQVFRIFQSLHPREKTYNLGIGLTLAKRIVEAYGGRIWVDSPPAAGGACLAFSLPLAT